MRGLHQRHDLGVRLQVQRDLGVGAVGKIVGKGLVGKRRVREHRLVPGLRRQHLAQQPADAIAQGIVRVQGDELLIVLRRAFRQHVVIGLTHRTAGQIRRHLHHRALDRLTHRRHRRIAEEGEVRGQRRTLPRRLLAIGRVVHFEANALEQLFDRHVRHLSELHESRDIRAVAVAAVERFGARRGRVADDRAVRRIDDRKAAAGVVDLRERVVAAGIEQDDTQPARDRFQRRHHVDQTDRVADQIVRRRDLGIDRDEIVFARELHAMPGIVDHRHGVLSAGGDLGGKVLHDLEHVVLRQVGRGDHLEAGRVEQLCHRSRIVAGIGEIRRVLVVRIADHQRDALLRTAQRGWRIGAFGICSLGEACAAADEAQQAHQQTGLEQRFETGHSVLLSGNLDARYVARMLGQGSRVVRDLYHYGMSALDEHWMNIKAL